MSLPYSVHLQYVTWSIKENGFNRFSLLPCVQTPALRKRNNLEGVNSMRARRMVKAFGLVDKLGKKLWREESSDSEDEEEDDKNNASSKNTGYETCLEDEEERRQWRKKIWDVIDRNPDIEEEVDRDEKSRRMQKLLTDYPLVVNEEDPNWSEDAADGWGFSLNQFFNKITIKNEKKEDDDDGYDSETEIVWQDDNYIRPIKDITTAEWEETVFKDISPLIVLVHNRYKRPKENENFRDELEKAVHIIWNCGLPSPRCVAVDAVVETDLVSALQVSVFPEIIFTKAGNVLYREKGIRTADELSKIMAFFYYGAAKPPCLNGVGSSQEQIPSVSQCPSTQQHCDMSGNSSFPRATTDAVPVKDMFAVKRSINPVRILEILKTDGATRITGFAYLYGVVDGPQPHRGSSHRHVGGRTSKAS